MDTDDKFSLRKLQVWHIHCFMFNIRRPKYHKKMSRVKNQLLDILSNFFFTTEGLNTINF